MLTESSKENHDISSSFVLFTQPIFLKLWIYFLFIWLYSNKQKYSRSMCLNKALAIWSIIYTYSFLYQISTICILNLLL